MIPIILALGLIGTPHRVPHPIYPNAAYFRFQLEPDAVSFTFSSGTNPPTPYPVQPYCSQRPSGIWDCAFGVGGGDSLSGHFYAFGVCDLYLENCKTPTPEVHVSCSGSVPNGGCPDTLFKVDP